MLLLLQLKATLSKFEVFTNSYAIRGRDIIIIVKELSVRKLWRELDLLDCLWRNELVKPCLRNYGGAFGRLAYFILWYRRSEKLYVFPRIQHGFFLLALRLDPSECSLPLAFDL